MKYIEPSAVESSRLWGKPPKVRSVSTKLLDRPAPNPPVDENSIIKSIRSLGSRLLKGSSQQVIEKNFNRLYDVIEKHLTNIEKTLSSNRDYTSSSGFGGIGFSKLDGFAARGIMGALAANVAGNLYNSDGSVGEDLVSNSGQAAIIGGALFGSKGAMAGAGAGAAYTAFKHYGDDIKSGFEKAKNITSSAIDTVTKEASSIWKKSIASISEIGDSISKGMDKTLEGLSNIGTQIKSKLDSVDMSTIANSAKNMLYSVVNAIYDKLKGLFDRIIDYFSPRGPNDAPKGSAKDGYTGDYGQGSGGIGGSYSGGISGSGGGSTFSEKSFGFGGDFTTGGKFTPDTSGNVGSLGGTSTFSTPGKQSSGFVKPNDGNGTKGGGGPQLEGIGQEASNQYANILGRHESSNTYYKVNDANYLGRWQAGAAAIFSIQPGPSAGVCCSTDTSTRSALLARSSSRISPSA
jgi:hypothetical protein